MTLTTAMLLVGCGGQKAKIAHDNDAFQIDVAGLVEKYNGENPPNQLTQPTSTEGETQTFTLVEDLDLILTTNEQNNVRQIQLVYTRTDTRNNAMALDGFAVHAQMIIDLVTVPDYQADAYGRLQPASDASMVNYNYNGISYKKAVEAEGKSLTVFPEKM